jgi:RNA polymerase sigma factor (sigma-70 family)
MIHISSGNEELALIYQAAKGDQYAFEALVKLYESSILTYLSALLGNWENARDIVQETFVAAYYALPRWIPPKKYTLGKKADSVLYQQDYVDQHPLAPWLYQIATNKALTFLKKQERHNQAALQIANNLSIGTLLQSAVDGTAIEESYIARELLQRSLKSLSEEDIACIILRFVLDETYAEIAERLHVSKEAVRKRISRGLNTLRSVYVSIEKREEIS